MDAKKEHEIKLKLLEQAHIAMKQAVEQQDSAMVAAIAELLKALNKI